MSGRRKLVFVLGSASAAASAAAWLLTATPPAPPPSDPERQHADEVRRLRRELTEAEAALAARANCRADAGAQCTHVATGAERIRGSLAVAQRQLCLRGYIDLPFADLSWVRTRDLKDVPFPRTLCSYPLGGKRITNLRDARIAHASLPRINWTEADLRRADFTAADLSDALLARANLAGATLWRATLQRVDLTGANLEDADLRHADLDGANLAHAVLREADLSDTDLRRVRELTQTQVDSARGNSRTVLPDGLVRPAGWR